MNYLHKVLYKERDRSRKLPFDVMNIIYEYSDPLHFVKQQIINKDYDLDEIMYQKNSSIFICGLLTKYNIYSHRTKLIIDLKANGHKADSRYSTKQLYKKWLKL